MAACDHPEGGNPRSYASLLLLVSGIEYSSVIVVALCEWKEVLYAIVAHCEWDSFIFKLRCDIVMDLTLILYIFGMLLAMIMGFFLFYIYYQDLFLLAKRNKTFARILGIVLLVIGVAGIFMPIVPGWLLIFVGLSLMRVLFLKKLVKRLAKKFGVKH